MERVARAIECTQRHKRTGSTGECSLIGVSVRGNPVADRKSETRSEAFLGMFAEAIREQQPPFLSVRITEYENAVGNLEPHNPERSCTKETLSTESASSQDSLLAAGVYTTAVLHLGALTPDVSFTDLKTALDLANRAWWRLEEARAPQFGHTEMPPSRGVRRLPRVPASSPASTR
jgi:hypothetical protein